MTLYSFVNSERALMRGLVARREAQVRVQRLREKEEEKFLGELR